MASSLVMSLIGAATLAAALLVGCGDNDAKPVSSKKGESCVRTADCSGGLICIANVCYSMAPVASGGAAGQSSTPPPPVGPVLGGEGESCTSRRDCADPLACFNQRCAASPDMGAGGAPSASPAQLGDRGETCRVNADCAATLVCVPSTLTGGVGVCDVTNFGIAPTGMTCGGECKLPTDCCQLPTAEQQDEGIKSCPDLTALLKTLAVDCTTVQVVGSNAEHLCFLDATYCAGCTATTWKCTASACVYNVGCTVAAGTYGPAGCPLYTRLGHAVPACNAKALKCTGTPAGCTTDASCATLPVADSASADICSAGECTCYSGDHQCYRKCARDLDCATGKVCDKTSKLCVPDTVCTKDEQCAEAKGSLDYKCDMTTNQCARACTADSDCSGTGHVVNGISEGAAFNNMVCTAGFCASVAGDCEDDSQCGAVNGYKTFCVDRTTATTGSVSSAITN